MVEAPTRSAAPPLEIHLSVESLGLCFRVLHLEEDSSPGFLKDEWDHILQWHLSQLAAESILVAGSISEAESLKVLVYQRTI